MTSKSYINLRCTLCNACLPVCPTQSIFLGKQQLVIDQDTCEGCGICIQVCPENAIHPVASETATEPSAKKTK